MFRRAMLVMVASVLLVAQASNVEACGRFFRCWSSVCTTTTCVTIVRISCEFQTRIESLECLLKTLQISDQKIIEEIAEMKRQLAQLRADNEGEVRRLDGRINDLKKDLTEEVRKIYESLRTLEGRVKRLEERVDKLEPRVDKLETSSGEQAKLLREQGKLIEALQSQLNTVSNDLFQHLHPPVPENPIMTWEQLVQAFPQLAQLHTDVERAYWRYEPGRILAHPVVTRLQLEALKLEVASGKKLLLVDTGVCIPQHLLGVLEHVTLRGSVAADDVDGGRGVLLVAVGQHYTIREFVLAVVLGWRLPEGKVETKEGLVVELNCETVIVHHRRN